MTARGSGAGELLAVGLSSSRLGSSLRFQWQGPTLRAERVSTVRGREGGVSLGYKPGATRKGVAPSTHLYSHCFVSANKRVLRPKRVYGEVLESL